MPAEDWRAGGFGLYVHWPFCQAKCPYCDFNSHVVGHVDQRQWADAYVREIARLGALTPDRRLDSVFFGGGTPSLMAPETVTAVLDAVRATWSVANDWEVTLEANPTSVEAARFAGYRDAGVNRVSLGIQSLDDDDLRRLGRLHTAEEARSAFAVARAAFDRVSFDLIYARQNQSLEAWRSELDAALEMAVDHLSLYQLSIEPGTAFADRLARGGLRGLPGEDLAADMYDLTVETCAASGLIAYEVSNFARGPDAISRHNMIYWSAGDYAGVGPGAHGRLSLGTTRWATEALSAPGAWIANFADGGAETWTALDSGDRVAEYLMMALRTIRGVSRTRLIAMGCDPGLERRIAALCEEGLLAADGDAVVATPRGRIVLNAVLRELLV